MVGNRWRMGVRGADGKQGELEGKLGVLDRVVKGLQSRVFSEMEMLGLG